jgi:histidinol dehydrogenase
MCIEISIWNELDPATQVALLERPALQNDAATRAQVIPILDQVRREGDAAIRRFTQEFDGVELSSLRVSAIEIDSAIAGLEPSALAAIELAIGNVRRFHEQQVPKDIVVETMPGVVCERVCQPLNSVGLYVPAGSAPLPSAAIMLSVPAAIAGCPVRVLCTPPRRDGTADPAVLAAAALAGVKDVFKIGGAQAVAAMAYGSESVPKVQKIFGPGNAWVTCAKTLVSTERGGAAIDMPAGPSEVLVIADGEASAEFVAADLLAQAEHGHDSQVILVTTSATLADEVQIQVRAQLQSLSRENIVRDALLNSRVIVVETVESAIALSNRYAPEHLILQIANARAALADVRNAGSVFVGPWTPESVGDYCSGTNHVLPTYGYADTYSGLGVDQFMRFMTVQELSRDGLSDISAAVITLAGLEGLDAHAAAVSRRLEPST